MQFDVEITLREDVAEARHRIARLVDLVGGEMVVDLAVETAAQGDQALGMPGEQFLVHARLVVVAVEKRGGDQLDEVLVTGVVLGEQGEMAGGFLGAAGLFLLHRTRCQVHLATDDRLDAFLVRGIVEFDGPEHVAMIGHGDGGHTVTLGLFHQVLDPHRTVQQRVLRVQVQVDKRIVGGGGHDAVNLLFSRVFVEQSAGANHRFMSVDCG